jgi:hypothetical protein
MERSQETQQLEWSEEMERLARSAESAEDGAEESQHAGPLVCLWNILSMIDPVTLANMLGMF